MIALKVFDEFSPLLEVVLGTSESFGGIPKMEDIYDPKTLLNVNKGTFPLEIAIRKELNSFHNVLTRYDVEVHRPKVFKSVNQIFTRDIGIVIGDQFLLPQILDKRSKEQKGIQFIMDQLDARKLLKVGGSARIEGGDVMPCGDHLFVGYSKKEDFDNHIVSRTNESGVDFLIKHFPSWKVKSFELKKSDNNPYENALHLDCCFQPIGKNKALIHKAGFKNQSDTEWIINFFKPENILEINQKEMYDMNSNIFSISPGVIVSELKFERLNQRLRDWEFIVEEISFSETAKMEGLLRCATLPLRRRYA
ncbi:MAG: amidinotransferase [Flammeovirgaceae bacterium]|nr:amidinotransferase [Flammeovirgaceae bacterium]